MSDLRDIFYNIVKPQFGEDGCPNICLYLDRDNKLLVDPLGSKEWREILRHVVMRRVGGALELIFGVDRSTADGQGTEFSDVYTCGYWKSTNPTEQLAKMGVWEIGVINYQGADKIVREWDWNNEFWKKQMGDEIRNYDACWDVLSKALVDHSEKEQSPSHGRPEISAEDLEKWTKQFDEWASSEDAPDIDSEESRMYFYEMCIMNEWLAKQLREFTEDAVLIQQQQAVAGARCVVGTIWDAGKRVLEDFKNGKIESPVDIQDKVFIEGIENGTIRLEDGKLIMGETIIKLANL